MSPPYRDFGDGHGDIRHDPGGNDDVSHHAGPAGILHHGDTYTRQEAAMTTSVPPAVSVHGLVKRYGDVLALDYFDLDVRQGEIFGLLGPNGSGKTTAINCILALLTYDAGQVGVFGSPMTPTSYALKRRIGRRAAGGRRLLRADRRGEHRLFLLPVRARQTHPNPHGRRGHRLRGTRRLPAVPSGQALRRSAAQTQHRLRHRAQAPTSSSSTSPPWPWTRKAATPSWRAS